MNATQPTASLITPHIELFKLNWLRDPSSAVEQGKTVGITDPHFIEMSAWCAELHAQLASLADERDMQLLLMGGNAAALRFEATQQRGSRDNDYLTTANRKEIHSLIDALVAQFAPHFKAPLFRCRELKGPPNTEPLPLAAFALAVPAILDRNATNGRLSIKLEFHIEEDPSLFPDAENISGRFFSLQENVDVRVPRLPYQIALKLMTLHEPPVGIDTRREDAIPRQLYDLDVLFSGLTTQDQWNVLVDYTRRRYAKEEEQRGRNPADSGPWTSILIRLDEWSHAGDDSHRYGKLIEAFQASQVAAGTRRPLEQWRGRIRRLQFAVRSLAQETSGYQHWKRALAIEARIEEPAGPRLKEYRNAIAQITGYAPRQLGQFPRVPYWTHLALAPDTDTALAELGTAIKGLEKTKTQAT